ncbi:MAG: outer membrane protein transport protein [Burkholderiales bacterium]|nr:outer membrane protein transport protein [Burkholderiales bacterium]MDE2628893.1 outer membrane protein transport protein [Burkholderiales bacterium]
MKTVRTALKLAPLAALLAAGSALATTGYFSHGYGMKAKGMGGVATALSQDSFGGANNPASMVWAGSRFDIGLDWFSPVRSAERTGAGFATLNGKVDSGKENFFIPELGYNRMVRDDLSLGVSIYGNGGMNTTYPQGNFNCGAGPANMLCGSGELGVDLTQLIVAPTMAYKLNAQHSVGVSLLLGYQRFKATGLQAFDNAPGFPPFTGSPGNVTNNGYDDAYGAGVRVGYMGHLTDAVSIGASYSSKVSMSKFKKYAGLFTGDGGFDIPSNYSVGVAFMPTDAWTFALDLGRINYSGVASVGNPSSLPAQLGTANGPGFGWSDVTVVKVGAAWRMNDAWTLRAGYNHGSNPISPADVTFNILAPGVVQDHYTLGFTAAAGQDSEITGALMVSPRRSVTGPSLFNGVLGAGAAGNETIRMRETSFGLAWSRRF